MQHCSCASFWWPHAGALGDASVDGAGNVLVAGFTGSTCLDFAGAANVQGFVRKYSSVDGALLWSHEFGDAGEDRAYAVHADASDNVLVAGRTQSGLGGANAGMYDAFVVQLSSAGAVGWTRQFGSAEQDYGFALNSDSMGRTILAGHTRGVLGASSAGGWDAFVAWFTP